MTGQLDTESPIYTDDLGRIRDLRLKHLEFIQTTIGRMGTNSFQVKTWSITLLAGILTLAPVEIAWGAGATALFFWGLDSYYLGLERRFRTLYELVRAQHLARENILFLDPMIAPDNATQGWRVFRKAAFSRSLVIFHFALVAVAIVGACTKRPSANEETKSVVPAVHVTCSPSRQEEEVSVCR